jgi:hypothetical protein
MAAITGAPRRVPVMDAGLTFLARRSNFEIARVDFWRSKPYRAYFDHLDKSGGFFYERWGDGA